MICIETGGYDVRLMASLTLEINGEIRTIPTVSNVRELLRHLKIAENSVAVELNGRIIRRTEWENTLLGDRDRVEIVQFVGGG